MVRSTEGRIIKGVGGFYTVLSEDGRRIVCKARGIFRKEGITPLPGDLVSVSIDQKNSAVISSVKPRKNELIRPSVANVDALLIVISFREPAPDLELVDKLILFCFKQGIEPVLVINKCDGGDDDDCREIVSQYAPAVGYIVSVSAVTGFGLDRLKALIADKAVCLAGQSAVGKSSLINALLGLDLKTGELSAKTERGRHTTRHAEFILAPEGGMIADTPGFSMLDPIGIEPEEIPLLYPEFAELSSECRFPGCLHVSEPGCAVKNGLKNGLINEKRYSRYVKTVNEAIETRRHKYD
ncbi:MAG: ribosome small subunit-dependent GTPase A [Clostridia bacterium]|nr:ribosome small subunit-dependent GTPase A [Clostridia bacterium]